MAARKSSGQARSLRWALAPAVWLGSAVCLWLGLPAGVFLFVLLVGFGWVEPAPEMTGPKTSVGAGPAPADGVELRKQELFSAARALRFAGFGWSARDVHLKRFAGQAAGPARLATGREKAQDLLASVLARLGVAPLQATTIMAVLLAVTAGFAPLQPAMDLWWVRLVNGLCLLIVGVGAASAQRSALNLPGVTMEVLFGDRRRIVIAVLLFVFGATLGAGAAVVVAGPVWVFVAASAVAAGFGLVAASARGRSREQWSQDVAARDEWLGRWQLLLKGQVPACSNTTTVGPFRQTTFTAPAGQSSQVMLNVAPQLPNVMGNVQAVFRPDPENVSSVNVVEWVESEWPDVHDPDTPIEVVQTALEVALASGIGQQGIFPVVDQVSPAHLEGSPQALWVANLSGADFDGLRRQIGWNAQSLTGGRFAFSALEHSPEFGGPMLLFGSPEADLAPEASETLARIATEDAWTAAWLSSLGTKMNAPGLGHRYTASATLPNRQRIVRNVFLLRQGETLQRVLVGSTEEKLRTSAPVDGAPDSGQRPAWLTCAGWLTNGTRPGSRHDIAFCVYTSNDPIPRHPGLLMPNPGQGGQTAQQWILAGMFNLAFDQARLPRPEVFAVRPVATSGQDRARSRVTGGRPGTIWQVQLRLYGTSFADVRGFLSRLTRFLGAEWARVAENATEPGCVDFYVGMAPRAGMTWLRPRDEQLVRALDWAQAWADSGVSGVAAAVPQLTGSATLPGNDQVLVLDFALPSGVDRDMIVKARKKLGTATGNSFIDVRPGDGGASTVRLLVAESDPMPSMVRLADYLDRPGPVPFAVDVTGSEVVYDPAESPHMAILGTPGSGKSISGRVLVLARLAAGSELFIADPMKGAADYKDFAPYARAFVVPEADEHGAMLDFEALLECEALLAFVHAEMRRRVGINSRLGCDYRTVPAEHAYPQWTVLIDEFESLVTSTIAVGKPSDDPEIEAERVQAIHWNAALAKMLTYVGKIAREGRSAGISMIVSGQKLTANDLEKVGLKTLKNNLGRILMGITTWGDRSSSLIEPEKAADLGDSVPPGRGLYEPRIGDRAGKGALAIQVVYADKESTAKVLAGLGQAEPVDLSSFVRKVETSRSTTVETVDMDEVAPVSEAVVVLDDMELSLDDLLAFDDQTDPVEDAEQPGLDLETNLTTHNTLWLDWGGEPVKPPASARDTQRASAAAFDWLANEHLAHAPTMPELEW